MSIVSRIVQGIGWAIGAILALGVVLVILDANEDNALVAAILDVGRFFADPFRQIFELDDNKLQIAINWGIAAVVYIVVAIALAAVVQTVTRRAGTRRETSAG